MNSTSADPRSSRRRRSRRPRSAARRRRGPSRATCTPGPPRPRTGISASTTASKPGAPPTESGATDTVRTNSAEARRRSAPRTFARPPAGDEPTTAACRAPSAAAEARVLRTWRTSASWRIPSTSGSRTSRMRTKSTTAAPRSSARAASRHGSGLLHHVEGQAQQAWSSSLTNGDRRRRRRSRSSASPSPTRARRRARRAVARRARSRAGGPQQSRDGLVHGRRPSGGSVVVGRGQGVVRRRPSTPG